MTKYTPTRRSVTAGLATAIGALAAPSDRPRPGEIGQNRDDRAALRPVGAAGPALEDGRRHGDAMTSTSAGGIKALGGAKIEIIYADAGDTTEKAKNAAQRLVSDQPDLVGGFGCWLSSFTLAVTEVTERASLPWLTLSYSDAITDRGFKFIFQTSPTADRQAEETVPTALKLATATTGKTPEDGRHHQDNTASPVSFTKPLRAGGLEKAGPQIDGRRDLHPAAVGCDAAHREGALGQARFPAALTSAMPDCKLVLEKLDEFNLAHGKIPLVGNGAPFGSPELLKTIGPELLEGLLFSVANWPMKGQEVFIERFKKKTGEPFLTQDGLCGYGHTAILAAALETAGAADKHQGRRGDPRDGPDQRAGGDVLPRPDQVR